jgi:hypothetical protein
MRRPWRWKMQVINNGKISNQEINYQNNTVIKTIQGFPVLKVYTAKWNSIGLVEGFCIDKPIVISVGGSGGKHSANRFVYVWRTQNEFKIVDMESGCPYEWKVLKGQVMLRRRLGELNEKAKFTENSVNKAENNVLGKIFEFFRAQC